MIIFSGMGFFFGFGLFICGIYMLVYFFRVNKIDAEIKEVSSKQLSNGKKVTNAVVVYFHENRNVTTKVLLKANSKAQIGNTIKITVDQNDPTKAKEYRTGKEIATIAGFLLIGSGIMLPGILMNL